jgi:hypothetical protein
MRAHSDRVSALIVGGGPVGLTLGLLLGRCGIDCLVVERRLGTSALPRATGVNVRRMEIFRGLGLGEQIRSVSLAGDGVPFLTTTAQKREHLRAPQRQRRQELDRSQSAGRACPSVTPRRGHPSVVRPTRRELTAAALTKLMLTILSLAAGQHCPGHAHDRWR